MSFYIEAPTKDQSIIIKNTATNYFDGHHENLRFVVSKPYRQTQKTRVYKVEGLTRETIYEGNGDKNEVLREIEK